MKLSESKELIKVYIDEYSTDGTLNPDGDNADYLLKHNYLADQTQKQLARTSVGRIVKNYEVTRNPLPNLLGDNDGFKTYEYLPDVGLSFEIADGKSYYLEIDNIGSFVVQENINGEWFTIKTVNNSSKSDFLAYKGILNKTGANNTIRIVFSGLYPYNVRNIAVFKYKFSSDLDVPDYQPQVSYSMPDDFMELSKILYREQHSNYIQTNRYKLEGKDKNTKLILN